MLLLITVVVIGGVGVDVVELTIALTGDCGGLDGFEFPLIFIFYLLFIFFTKINNLLIKYNN